MESAQSQKIKISGIEYKILDSIQDLRVEDSFIHRSNKLAQFEGNGEAKKYVGSYRDEKIQVISNFFDYSNWGVEYKDQEKNKKTMAAAKIAGAVMQDQTCFFSKANLLQYLEDAKVEYFAKEQGYHQDIGAQYAARLEEIKNLPSDYIYFSIYDASDGLTQTQSRAYIRSDDLIWNVWRKLILPKISYLSILKIVPDEPTAPNEKPLFYFRVVLDYQYRSLVHPSLLKEYEAEPAPESPTKKSYRVGADKYRRAVIDHMPQCPFTLITEERLLIASHIKPYIACMKEGREDQALHHLNGLSLSPTYDRLFDQGFITFTDDGDLICGTQLNAITWSRLNINPASNKRMRIFPEEREEYLEYHRRHVFQGNIDEFI
ncbi:HNH endonuclease [Polynucleobacter paneuropaeus]|uniref:HNH endonuclease n=1 Tax=Polynucleobacter paneuropaeus TaxID=2527775 RepID=UPI000DBF0A61|nr:HNH endonuclease [Polynucleobacter paneuropaeus]AWW46998.1 HNH endonuclease [Polynucleobacter paneuropaeus]